MARPPSPKSIEPLSQRIALPENLTSKDPAQALQQFVSQSTWDEQAVLTRYRSLMAEHFASPQGVFIFDDTSFPKRGRYSVGVSHQDCGALGKRANCQVAVTLHSSNPCGHFPLALRLHLPETWTNDDQRFRDEAERVYTTLGETTEEQDTCHLFEVVSRLTEKRGGRISIREFVRSKHKQYPTAEAAEAALQSLVDAGFGFWDEGPAPGSGGHRTKHFTPRSTVDTRDD